MRRRHHQLDVDVGAAHQILELPEIATLGTLVRSAGEGLDRQTGDLAVDGDLQVRALERLGGL